MGGRSFGPLLLLLLSISGRGYTRPDNGAEDWYTEGEQPNGDKPPTDASFHVSSSYSIPGPEMLATDYDYILPSRANRDNLFDSRMLNYGASEIVFDRNCDGCDKSLPAYAGNGPEVKATEYVHPPYNPDRKLPGGYANKGWKFFYERFYHSRSVLLDNWFEDEVKIPDSLTCDEESSDILSSSTDFLTRSSSTDWFFSTTMAVFDESCDGCVKSLPAYVGNVPEVKATEYVHPPYNPDRKLPGGYANKGWKYFYERFYHSRSVLLDNWFEDEVKIPDSLTCDEESSDILSSSTDFLTRSSSTDWFFSTTMAIFDESCDGCVKSLPAYVGNGPEVKATEYVHPPYNPDRKPPGGYANKGWKFFFERFYHSRSVLLENWFDDEVKIPDSVTCDEESSDILSSSTDFLTSSSTNFMSESSFTDWFLPITMATTTSNSGPASTSDIYVQSSTSMALTTSFPVETSQIEPSPMSTSDISIHSSMGTRSWVSESTGMSSDIETSRIEMSSGISMTSTSVIMSTTNGQSTFTQSTQSSYSISTTATVQHSSSSLFTSTTSVSSQISSTRSTNIPSVTPSITQTTESVDAITSTDTTTSTGATTSKSDAPSVAADEAASAASTTPVAIGAAAGAVAVVAVVAVVIVKVVAAQIAKASVAATAQVYAATTGTAGNAGQSTLTSINPNSQPVTTPEVEVPEAPPQLQYNPGDTVARMVYRP